ncbi:hypothetical protein FEK33_03815 [Nocardia asteroides NBRC 15531]|uniref:Uncharacterized protein n=1 Tax=Nocardia asteroides NBRC 15531 TaxID=1110697 RepID=U5E800_NOCAS|nr:hypothetical protein [Nocardia asteroides]TLF69431.1 hypothetical protein FEK33_03815 [Nocardia asteroides NBRC 15531]UGT48929.1 hypothetical protein LT345_31660 [Nocardia asteroides]SFL74988.1 hypothetical protein SAMN05444423_101774 [Nocardia asteroides]VEG31302.1 Uncharacterised protein [Nocardia asteroides]GAD83475.1 hypothetical protein NCAST_20_00400 [Nocardia asteroides NBRC 15531]
MTARVIMLGIVAGTLIAGSAGIAAAERIEGGGGDEGFKICVAKAYVVQQETGRQQPPCQWDGVAGTWYFDAVR